MLGERTGVLIAAGGAPWEVEALRLVSGRGSGAVLLKRCVDLPDLLATAATGQARVAVVAAELTALDADSLGHLSSAGVAVVAIAGPEGPGVAAELPASRRSSTRARCRACPR